jgi:hypothetical protein
MLKDNSRTTSLLHSALSGADIAMVEAIDLIALTWKTP